MIWIILGIIVVLVLIVVGVYNGLVKSRMQTREAWSQIDVQLKRRNDLIPNLIETVKGYAKYEGDTLAKVTQLRQQVAQASSPAEAMAASDALSRQVAGIFAVAENYPDLKANTNFMQLQEELTNTENKISYARQLYNSVTSNYNVKLETFPSNVIAKMFGFKAAEFLETPEEEKAVPKVDFSGLGNLICYLIRLLEIRERLGFCFWSFSSCWGLVGYGVGYLWLGSGFGGLILALVIGFYLCRYHDFPINQCRYGYEWCTRG